jgi:ABC-type antimicrobial peptide transport system permease subunit
MALGARRGQVVGSVIGQGMVLTTIGIVAGVLGALGLTRFLQSLLYEVRPTDPWTIGVMAISVAAAGLLACAFPALKAGFVDPATILRDE